jgi:peptide-methionine (S)-S-oxide reductase
LEAWFQQVRGVVETSVVYEGGALEKPTYKDVCTDRTGHAEVVEVTFDPQKVSYTALLNLFFELHDPTQVNRQGPDWGTQYRTVIFFHSPEQEAAARETIARLEASHQYAKPIATQVVPAETFWRAEEYHQKYLEKRGAVSCHI